MLSDATENKAEGRFTCSNITMKFMKFTQAPKFYESEDSSSKTDAPADEIEKAQTEPERNLELQEFEDTIPESMEESGTPASDSGSSKIEVLEIKPTAVKVESEPVTKEVEIVKPIHQQRQQNLELDTEEAFVLSEEMQLLLNTFKPSKPIFYYFCLLSSIFSLQY